MLIDIVQNKRTNLSNLFRLYFKRIWKIISYRFINLVLITVIETIQLINLLMVQPGMSVS